MGLKFPKVLGAEVTLFTRSHAKESEARRLGADHVVLSTDPAQMKAVAGQFDFILDSVPNQHDHPYLLRHAAKHPSKTSRANSERIMLGATATRTAG